VNIQEYISSGIVESYVLGLATEQERAEFEQLCIRNPELVAARIAFEEVLEKQSLDTAVPPPSHIKQALLEQINNPTSSNQAKLITMERTPVRSSGGLRFLAAASVILLLVAGYFAYDFYTENKKLQSSAASLQSQLDSTKNVLDRMAGTQQLMSNPNVTVVNMVATTSKPASANVYWDSTSTNVWLVVKNMPQLPSDKQYQLWALIDGQNPTDLGLFDVKEENFILQMKGAKNAQAFAITIENRGNATGKPDLGQLQSHGKAKL
jgi:anti-sigma-K factor RskA